MGGGKRKRAGYIDRSVIIEHQTKKMNMIEGLLPEAVSGHITSPERFYTHKLVKYCSADTYDMSFCPAYVKHNEICVLVAPKLCNDELSIVSVSFQNAALHTGDKISGKRKKGAYIVQNGVILCTATLSDGTSLDLRTPIGGQVLEINENILTRPELLLSSRLGEGFIAIVYPNTKLPSLIDAAIV